jgi:hypothetical protein
MAGEIKAMSGAGFPRHKFDTAHTTLFKSDMFAGWWMFNNLIKKE